MGPNKPKGARIFFEKIRKGAAYMGPKILQKSARIKGLYLGQQSQRHIIVFLSFHGLVKIIKFDFQGRCFYC